MTDTVLTQVQTPAASVTTAVQTPSDSGTYDDWGSHKFWLAVFFSITSVGLCWYTKLSGSEWVTIAGIVLGLHNFANVLDKKLNG